jgi:cation diffusion facilitator CzcD-associated flavoprotein CzcO
MGSVLDTESNSEPSSPSPPLNVRSIAIIGAGPAGLAAAKYLLAQCSPQSSSSPFTRITLFEQQAQVGGVWNYCPVPAQPTPIPQTSAFYPPDLPSPDARTADGKAVFPSPVYERLNTNIPHTVMQYTEAGFGTDERTRIFPVRDVVQSYLESYARDVRPWIRFSTSVVDVALRQEDGRDRWDVRSRDLTTSAEEVETYDAVVVASGHYSTAYVPDMEGIRAFDAKWPGMITHSKSYRTPEVYRGKKVLLVGNSASGLDIALQIVKVCERPLFVSVRTPTATEVRENAGFEEVVEIRRFLVEERGVELKDGRVITGLDAVLFCTGYLFSFPFLKSMDPPLVTDGRRVYGLYKHFIHIRHPTLVFVGLPIKVMPFPLMQAQASVFARIWADTLTLPPRKAMEEWERKEAEGKGSKFHVFPKFADAEYINGMHDWAIQDKGKGKEPPEWSDEMLWQTGIYPQARLKFEQTGKTARTLEELGFVYKPKVSDVEEARKLNPDLDIAG